MVTIRKHQKKIEDIKKIIEELKRKLENENKRK